MELVISQPVVKAGGDVSEKVSKAIMQLTEAIQRAPGKTLVIVADDTQSMDDNREWLTKTLADIATIHGKEILAVITYSQGKTQVFKPGEKVVFVGRGGYENTWGAMQEALKFNPANILVISDEYGNDWPDQPTLKINANVIAVCIERGCSESFTRLVTDNPGGTLCDMSK